MTYRASPTPNGAHKTRASRRGRSAFLPVVLAIAAAAAAGSGCLAILGDFDEPADGPVAAASTSSTSASSGGGGGDGGAAASSSATGGGGGESAASSSAAGTGGSSAGPCPSERGSPMVLVPGPNGGDDYCVDATETTKGQYDAWLQGGADPAADQPSYCSWNATHDPKKNGACGGYNIKDDPNRPIACVNWCDAYAYCAWAGKRLCGKIGGGPNSYQTPSNPSEGQWYRACSGGGAFMFPYGNNYDGARCVSNDYDGTPGYTSATDVPVDVGTANCEGGYPGLRDMSGNIYEWEDACEAYNVEGDKCAVRGGSCEDGQNMQRCDMNLQSPRNEAKNERGFRCCAEAVATP